MKPLDVRKNEASDAMVARNHKLISDANMNALAFVIKNPGCTAGEYNAHLGADMANVITASRPLDWLKRHGCIKAGEIRKCKAKGTPMTTWNFVSIQPKKLGIKSKHKESIEALEKCGAEFSAAIEYLKGL